MLQLIISVPPMIIFVYYWIVPESVRWLLTKNRYEAHKHCFLVVSNELWNDHTGTKRL